LNWQKGLSVSIFLVPEKKEKKDEKKSLFEMLTGSPSHRDNLDIECSASYSAPCPYGDW
jgi:hypothetical protein